MMLRGSKSLRRLLSSLQTEAEEVLKMSTIKRKIISTAEAPQPVAPYNQAVQVDNTLYLSGVLGLNINSNTLVTGGAAAEAKQALKNMEIILKAASCSLANVVKTTIFLASIEDFSDVNDVYKTYFKKPYPARSAFQVGKLPLNARVEIEAIAVVGTIQDV